MKVVASPEAPLARLHKIAPMPTICHREHRSAKRAKTGAPKI
jgi:hypothetical protein